EFLHVRLQLVDLGVQRGEVGVDAPDVAARGQHARGVVVMQLRPRGALDRDVAAVAVEQRQGDADAEAARMHVAGVARGVEADVQRGELGQYRRAQFYLLRGVAGLQRQQVGAPPR